MDIAKALSGGDRRSIGRSNEVAAYVLRRQFALPELMRALASDDVVVRMRAADALEKVSAARADLCDPFARDLLFVAAKSDEQEVRWHAAQILPRLTLSRRQRGEAVDLLFEFLQDKSRIVQAFALTALVDFAEDDKGLRERVTPLVRRAAASGAPSVKARAKKLMDRIGDAP